MEQAIKPFDSETFNPEKYVKELCQRCVGGLELQQERMKIQNIADDTNNLLKKNVYLNYELFISTAKEISRLEGDMYQLSHLLSELKSVLTILSSSSVLLNEENSLSNEPTSIQNKEIDDSDEANEIKRKRALSDIAEKVEGCINLTENCGRFFLFEGDLLELDAVDNSFIKKLHCYLLSDVVLLTTPIINRRTPACYKLETVYDVTNLAVVNVKDVKNAFKLLAFPDTRVFQATSSQTNKDWLEMFEEAKKIHVSGGQNKKRTSVHIDQKSPTRTISIEYATNPFDEELDGTEEEEEESVPEWLLEVAEDLDVLLVERHFEDAYALTEKTKIYLKESPINDPILVQDITGKLDARIKSLTQMLTKELEMTPNKSHQGGLKAARRAVKLLNTLNKSTQACDLFLKLCTSLLKSHLKRVKRENATASYVKQMSVVFFSNLCNISKEFQYHCFPNNPSCSSAFVVWCIHEINFFMTQLTRHAFVPQTSLATIAECVTSLHTYGNQLSAFGVDMMYQIDGQLRTPITRALLIFRDKMIESTKLSASDDMWNPMNLKTRQQREKLINEFSSLGLHGLEKYSKDDCFLELTEYTISFCRSYITFFNNSLSVALPIIIDDVEQILNDVLVAFIRHFSNSSTDSKLETKRDTIKINAMFLIEDFLPYCGNAFKKHLDMDSNKLNQLRTSLKELTAVSVTVTGYV